MEFNETSSNQTKTKLVVGLVVVGIVVLGVGAFVAFKKRAGGTSSALDRADTAEVERWCELREEWARAVDPLAGDIVLKSVQEPEKSEELLIKRNTLCQKFALKVRELKTTSERIRAVEVALIREGKVRANTAVAIANQLAQADSVELPALRSAVKALEGSINERIVEGKAGADEAVRRGLAAMPECKHIYRGPMTDEDTADNPYISWDELDFRRLEAIKELNERIRKREPQEQWRNLVYHKLIAQYGRDLKKCHRRFKKKNPRISNVLGLRVRLKRNGAVATLAIEWMDVREDKILDCFLGHAGKWRLPRPIDAADYLVLTLDFSKM